MGYVSMYRTKTYNMYWNTCYLYIIDIIINHIYGLAGDSTIGIESWSESVEF